MGRSSAGSGQTGAGARLHGRGRRAVAHDAREAAGRDPRRPAGRRQDDVERDGHRLALDRCRHPRPARLAGAQHDEPRPVLRGRVRRGPDRSAGEPPAVPVPPSAGTVVVTQPDGSPRPDASAAASIASPSGAAVWSTRCHIRHRVQPDMGDQPLERVAVHGHLEHGRVGPADRVGEAVRRRIRHGRRAATRAGDPPRARSARGAPPATPSRRGSRSMPCPRRGRRPSRRTPAPRRPRCRRPRTAADCRPRRGASCIPATLVAARPARRPRPRAAIDAPSPSPRHIGHCRQPPAIASTANASSSVAAIDARQAVPVRRRQRERRGGRHRDGRG